MVITVSACHTEATRFPVKNTRPVATETACKPDKYADLIGQNKPVLDTQKLPAQTRIIGPNTMVTMDYSAERLNVHHNKAGKIIQFTCG
jgi:hypothetical protein